MPKHGEAEGQRASSTSHWTSIYLATQNDQEAGGEALNKLLETYRKPLLLHLQYKFHVSEQDSEDLFQSFVIEKILVNRLLEKADRTRGPLRTFIRSTLDHFVLDQIDWKDAEKRGGKTVQVRQEEAEKIGTPPPVSASDRAWALKVIQQAEDQTRIFYQRKNTARTWAVFSEAIVQPLRENTIRASDAELASKHSFKSARQVSNAITTVRRQFGKVLRAVIAEYVENPNDQAQIDEELWDLYAILSDPG